MRYAQASDSNQADIVRMLRNMGFSVTDTHNAGKGFPDLAVGIHGHSFNVEIKDGSKIPSKRALTADQLEWHRDWRGHVAILESVDDAVLWGNYIRAEVEKCIQAGVCFQWGKTWEDQNIKRGQTAYAAGLPPIRTARPHKRYSIPEEVLS